MNESAARTMILVLAALFGVFAVLFVISGSFFALASRMPLDAAAKPSIDAATARVMQSILLAVGVFFLLVAVASGAAAFGLWRYHAWGRLLSLALSYLGCVVGILSIAVSLWQGSAESIAQLLLNAPSTAACVAFIWLLQFEPTVVGLFRSAGRQG